MKLLRQLAVVLFSLAFLAGCGSTPEDGQSRDRVAEQLQFTAKTLDGGEYGIDSFTNLNDETGAVWAKFEVPAQPAFAFISAGGKIERVNGTVTEQEIVRWLETRARS